MQKNEGGKNVESAREKEKQKRERARVSSQYGVVCRTSDSPGAPGAFKGPKTCSLSWVSVPLCAFVCVSVKSLH